MQFIPDKVDIYDGIRNIISEDPLIKIHPNIIPCDQ